MSDGATEAMREEKGWHQYEDRYDQPPPVTSVGPAIWDLVVKDMRDRDRVGRLRYGMPLRPSNGRDMLADAYQEVLDAAVYLRGALHERDGR